MTQEEEEAATVVATPPVPCPGGATRLALLGPVAQAQPSSLLLAPLQQVRSKVAALLFAASLAHPDWPLWSVVVVQVAASPHSGFALAVAVGCGHAGRRRVADR